MPPNVTVDELSDSLHQALDLHSLAKEKGRYLVYPDKKVKGLPLNKQILMHTHATIVH